MRCSTGKVRYSQKHLAEEALVHLHSIYKNPGARTIYLCGVCGDYHLTSQGELSDSVKDSKKSGELLKKSEAEFWERKLKKP